MSGKAISNSRRLTKTELIGTFGFISDILINKLYLDKRSFIPAGSYCKKAEGEMYGDLDILIESSYITVGTIDFIFTELGYKTYKMSGFDQISIEIPICGDSTLGFAQVDLMLTNNLKWSEFAYYSPAAGESKYKAMYLGSLIMAIVSESYKKLIKDSSGILQSYSMLAYRLNEGIVKVTKSHIGKKGYIKTAKIIDEEFLTDDPAEVMILCFGNKTRVKSFEEVWTLINDPDFIHKEKLPEILSKYKYYLTNAHVEFPKELEERKINTHIKHIEELLFEEGGIELMETVLTGLYIITLDQPSDLKLSVKIDGSPAMFGWSKFDGLPDYGVSTKVVFNKTPITCHTDLEIDLIFGNRPNLAHSLKLFLKYIEFIHIPVGEMWQGDFLFDDNSLQIASPDSYSFRPNTIKYFAKKELIGESDFGIMWHTRYTGSIINPRAHYDVDISKLCKIHGLYMADPYLKNVKDYGNFSIQNDITNIRVKLEELKSIHYEALMGYKTFNVLFQKYHNQVIKKGEVLDNDFQSKFLMFVRTEKGDNVALKVMEIIAANTKAISLIIQIIFYLTEFKNYLSFKLNKHAPYQSFVELKTGELQSINQEGFAISTPNGDIVKFVDRGAFSFLNFSNDVIKGWEHE